MVSTPQNVPCCLDCPLHWHGVSSAYRSLSRPAVSDTRKSSHFKLLHLLLGYPLYPNQQSTSGTLIPSRWNTAWAKFWAEFLRFTLQAMLLARDTAHVQLCKQILKPATALGKLYEPRRYETGNGFESSEGHGCSCRSNMSVLRVPVVKQRHVERCCLH